MNLRDKTLPELAILNLRIKLARLAIKAGVLFGAFGNSLITLGERLTPKELRRW